MIPTKIIEQLKREPFRPFAVCLSDGSSYEIRHPEMALVTRATVAVALIGLEEEVPDDMVICDPQHITQLKPLESSRGTSARE